MRNPPSDPRFERRLGCGADYGLLALFGPELLGLQWRLWSRRSADHHSLDSNDKDPTFTRFTSVGMAYALTTDSQRRIYVATGNKRELSGLTRLLPNGSKDTNFAVSIDWTGISPEYGAWINALVIDSQGRVVIGGHFSSVNGQSRWGLARLLGDGRLDDSFNPGFPSGTVATLNLLEQDSILVVSGCPPQMGRDDDAIELPSGDPAHIFIVEADGALDLTLDGDLGFTMPSYWGHGKVKATYVLRTALL